MPYKWTYLISYLLTYCIARYSRLHASCILRVVLHDACMRVWCTVQQCDEYYYRHISDSDTWNVLRDASSLVSDVGRCTLSPNMLQTKCTWVKCVANICRRATLILFVIYYIVSLHLNLKAFRYVPYVFKNVYSSFDLLVYITIYVNISAIIWKYV